MKEGGGTRGHQQQSLHSGDDTYHLFGYKTDLYRQVLFCSLCVISFGILPLLAYWKRDWYLWFRAVPCCFDEADLILVIDDHNVKTVVPVLEWRRSIHHPLLLPRPNGSMREVESYKYIIFRKLAYIYFEEKEGVPETGEWVNPHDIEMPLNNFHAFHHSAGFTEAQVDQRLTTYGKNAIEVEVRTIGTLLVKEVITPFYVFQAFSVIVWLNDEYMLYAGVIVIMTAFSCIQDVYQIRKQEVALREMVHSSSEVEVKRNGEACKIDSTQLVPGDILLISPHGCILQCDCILMTGTVIVNESMLTGESVPVTKVALPEDDDISVNFCLEKHSKHVLFGGTQVLQTRYYHGQKVQAIVLRTAYSTLKGSLVRSIMYPKPVDFSFTKDLLKFVLFLGLISGFGFVYSLIIMYKNGATLKRMLIRALDIITITVPPALPAAMSVGMLAAQKRLRKQNVFCTSPSTINTCGGINVVCFDKTGTLTEDGLDFHRLRAVKRQEDGTSVEFCEETDEMKAETSSPGDGELITAIATCHSLTRINGNLMGDPLDLVLFLKTNWVLELVGWEKSDETDLYDTIQPTVIKPPPVEEDTNKEGFSVIRQFTFSSSLQRMSVIVYNPATFSMFLYCKGSPEMIYNLCDKSSVPKDYMEKVNNYAENGYRLIAVAMVELKLSYVKAAKVAREQVECNLHLLGLVAMENRVKEQTYTAIPKLIRANIRCVMVTGDNVLTALSVARECGIIRPEKKTFILEHSFTEKDQKGRTKLTLRQSVSAVPDEGETANFSPESSLLIQSSYQICISGPTFAVITHEYPELLDELVCVCDVFARMAPDQKQQLVNHLQEVNYTVAMCGDGANDCAALKAAHAGISLSDSEASIAAPFTSKINNISCVPIIIAEGRCALVTSFGMFRYMAGYSLNQFVTVTLLYSISNILTDGQFLYIDLGLIVPLSAFFGFTPASPELHHVPPPTRLLSLASIVAVLGQLLINGGFQLLVFCLITYQPWFKPYHPPVGDEEEDKKSMQGTAIFYLSTFQYIMLAVVYSKGRPYRSPMWMSVSFLLATIATILCSLVFLFRPSLIASYMEIEIFPEWDFYFILIAIVIANAVCCFAFEHLIVVKLIGYIERKKKERRLAQSIEQEDYFSGIDPAYEKIILRIGRDTDWLQRSISSATSPDQLPTTSRSILSSGTTMTSISEIRSQ